MDQSVLYTSEEEEEEVAECALWKSPGAAVAGDICPWQGEYGLDFFFWHLICSSKSAEVLQELLVQKAQGVLCHPGVCHAHGGRLA